MIAPEQLRFFLIIGILMTGFLLYQAWQVDYAVKKPAAISVAGTSLPEDGIPSRPSVESSDEVPVIPDTAVLPYSQAVPNSESKRIRVLTDVYDLWFDPVGGGLVQAELLDYPIATDQPDNPVRLLNEYGKDVFIMQSGLLSQKSSNNTVSPNHKQLFSVERNEYVLGHGDNSLEVPFVWHSEDGLVVTKNLSFYPRQLPYRSYNAHRQWVGTTLEWSFLWSVPSFRAKRFRRAFHWLYLYRWRVIYSREAIQENRFWRSPQAKPGARSQGRVGSNDSALFRCCLDSAVGC